MADGACLGSCVGILVAHFWQGMILGLIFGGLLETDVTERPVRRWVGCTASGVVCSVLLTAGLQGIGQVGLGSAMIGAAFGSLLALLPVWLRLPIFYGAAGYLAARVAVPLLLQNVITRSVFSWAGSASLALCFVGFIHARLLRETTEAKAETNGHP